MLEQQSRMKEKEENDKKARKVARKAALSHKEADSKANKVGMLENLLIYITVNS